MFFHWALLALIFFPSLFHSEYPTTFAAGDGTVGDANDLANVGDAHRFQCLALGIADVVVGMALRHEKVAALFYPFRIIMVGLWNKL